MSKSVTFTAYSISANKASTTNLNFIKNISQGLKKFPTIDKRFMRLSSIEDQFNEGDFIAMYENFGNKVFGLFMRMKEGEFAHILKEHLNKQNITFDEIERQSEANVVGTLKSYAYFLCNNKTLIYMSGGLRIKDFQTYITWLCKQCNITKEYVFNPIITKQSEIAIKDIKEIVIADALFYKMDQSLTVTKSFKLWKSDILKHLIANSKDLPDIDLENIISAKIELKFRTKAIEKEKQLTALIKSVENDDIIIKDKKGKTIKGAEYQEKRVEKVDTTKGGFPVEQQVKQKMAEYLQAIGND